MSKKPIKIEDNQEISSHLRQQLQALPDSPGVYIMRDSEGIIIYVGKATSLKQRVRSYFQAGTKHSPKTAMQMTKVMDLEWVVVESPVEALILESNLIKEHDPKYNISLRDDKHYPYLKICLNEKFPRMLVVRSTKNDGNRYFGPYVSSSAMHLTEKIIRNIFPLRTCGNSDFKSRTRPCLNKHIGKCLAPCMGKISKEDYAKLVEQVIYFLEGRTDDIVKSLTAAMNKASKDMRFEEAARYRDQIEAVKLVQCRQQMDAAADSDRDVVALAASAGQAVVQVFFVREGKVVGKEHFFMDNSEGAQAGEILAVFISQYYNGNDFIPPEICLPMEIDDSENIENWLSQKRGVKVELIVPQKGSKKRLVDLVTHNAELVLARELEILATGETARSKALEELQYKMGLPKLPYRIECFDNSHWQGTYTVSAMTTFCGGLPVKHLYRRFRIKTVCNGDDYAAMAEAVSRRLGRGIEEREKLKKGEIRPEEALMAEWPDLLLIDGGKGQLSVVVGILEALQLDIPVWGLAERFEELYEPGHSEPLILDKNSPALQLLQRVRDESHRFAISYQRKLRQKGQVSSLLDNVPGIGPNRRRALLLALGSLENIVEASVEELALVNTMNKRAAQSLYDYLHPEVGGEE